jgi:hypothetical protein
MRRVALLCSIAFVAVLSVSAQNTKKEKPATAWKTGGMFSLIGGQSGSRNWAPTGSEKLTFATAVNLNLWAAKKWGRNTWDNTADLSYGLLYTRSEKSRKTNDKIDLYSHFNHSLVGLAGLGTIANLRSQFTNGYDYTENPRKRISGFFAPAYLTFAPVVFSVKSKDNSLTFSATPAAARWVIVTNSPYSLNYQGGVKPDGSQERTLAELYGVDPGKKVDFQVGPYVSALFKKEIVKNVMWKTRLDINMDFNQTHLRETDVYWTNTIGMTVNKWLKVNYTFDLYQDADVNMFGPNKDASRTQMLSLLGVGLGVSF